MKTPVILQVLPSLKSGGVERGTIEIARAIAARGWVSLVASSGGPMAGLLKGCGAEHIELPLHSKNPFVLWRNSRRLAKIIRQRKVDIIHARSRAPAWSAKWAAKRTGCKFMTTFHGFYGLKSEWKRKYNSIMTQGERVIAISHFIAEHIRKEYGADAARIRIIQRGVDLKLFNPNTYSSRRLTDLAKQWHIPDHLPLILYPGRLTRWKGQEAFIKALQQLPHRNFFAVILGDAKGHANFRADLEKLIVGCGLAEHVRIIPHTQRITDAYLLARLVVSTSIEPEAFGRVILEAQAMGRPVIATDHGGARETVIPNVTGWLVTPHDVHGLAAVLNHALNLSEEEQHWMSEQATLNATRFSMETMCEKTLAVYEELLPEAATLPTSPASDPMAFAPPVSIPA